MGIAAELRAAAELRKGGVEIAQKASDHVPILGHSGGPQTNGQGLDLYFEDFLESGMGAIHQMDGASKGWRWATARAYSRQTS